MSSTNHGQEQQVFLGLSPMAILNLIESALGARCSNLCRPYNSYINRVYELADADGRGLVVKFYRPGRWSIAALQDEHDFLRDLTEAELPVIAPLVLQDGSTLGQYEGVRFAVFPKKGGRYPDEFDDEQWVGLGHLLGRAHMVGARRLPKDRPRMHPAVTTTGQVDFILKSGLLPDDMATAYSQATGAIIKEITPFFDQAEFIRIHGDCHRANLIYRPGESLYLIDLDDMMVGPPVQDLWMLLPGTIADSAVEVDLFLEGYETFRHFDKTGLRLIEPLRAMRYIHYSAWCAHQVIEDGATQVIADFGSRTYWQAEIGDLVEQLDRIRNSPAETGNILF